MKILFEDFLNQIQRKGNGHTKEKIKKIRTDKEKGEITIETKGGHVLKIKGNK